MFRHLSEQEYLKTMPQPGKWEDDFLLARSALDAYLDEWFERESDAEQIEGLHKEYVWRSAEAPCEHIILASNITNLFVVVVHDLRSGEVIGHRVLDINRLYGLPDPRKREELGK